MPTTQTAHPARRRHPVGITLVAGLCLVLLLGLLSACEQSESSPAAAVPVLTWEDCGDGLECSTATVPLDHDESEGEPIELSLVRLPATDQDRRIGSLFTNPGGPGLSGVAYLRRAVAEGLFPEQLRARFDIIGLDPRGVGESTPVRCFSSVEEQAAFAARNRLWPTKADEVDAFVQSQETLAHRCADENGELLDHMSTANVARDIDLLREAVGEDQLSFLGKSYGTYLGATYASMFPDRVRALVLDGVAEPVAYVGVDDPDESTPWLRAGAHLGAAETLDQFLELCGKAGERCPFGVDGDPRKKLAELVDTLTDAPLLIYNHTNEPTEVGVDSVLATVLNGLYVAADWSTVGATLQAYVEMAAKPDDTVHPAPAANETTNDGYNNSADAQSANICVDANHPDTTEEIGAAAVRARQDSPYAADRWSWGISGVCPTWAGEDEDRYTGPFDPETATPVLIVGTRFDPATPYRNAEQLVGDLPNAGLLALNGWGHTASFEKVSACVDDAVTEYLITQQLQAAESLCEPDPGGVPFASRPQG